MRFVPASLVSLLLAACAPEDSALEGLAPLVDDGVSSRVIVEYTPAAAGVLALLNAPTTDLTVLDIDAALDRRAATNLINHRNGRDGRLGTRDDDLYGTIAEADAVAYVGDVALAQLLAYASNNGFVPDGTDPYGTIEQVAFTWDEAEATLALANTATLTVLDIDAGLDARAANAIVAGRPFVSLEDVAAAAYVGRSALDRMRVWVNAHPADTYTTVEAMADLTASSAGLWYTSESDYPLTPFTVVGAGYDPVTLANAKVKLGSVYVNRPGEATLLQRSVEQRTIADVLDRYTVPQFWWDPTNVADAVQWSQLRAIFDTQLTDVTVIRFGEVLGGGPNMLGAIDVFILGVTADGDIVGVKTISVET